MSSKADDQFDATLGETTITRVRDNNNYSIRSLYAKQPIVLIFFRRFGCPLCRTYAMKLSKELHPILKKNNVGLVGIGLERFGIEEFEENEYFSGELYIDQGKKAYRALSLPYLGWFKGIVEICSKSARAWNEQAQQMGVSGNIKGDGFQLGASYILGPQDGQVWFSHRQKDYGDHPTMEEIIQALRDHIPDFRG